MAWRTCRWLTRSQLSGCREEWLEEFGLILHWFKGHNLGGRKKTKREECKLALG